jgi:hypothetical protein
VTITIRGTALRSDRSLATGPTRQDLVAAKVQLDSMSRRLDLAERERERIQATLRETQVWGESGKPAQHQGTMAAVGGLFYADVPSLCLVNSATHCHPFGV